MAWLTGRHIARSRSKHAKGTAKRAAQDQTQNFGISSDEKRMPDENRKSVTRDEGKSPPMEDWLATNAEIQKLAAATPAVAPHSCPHCREWELDIYHHTLNHVKQPSNGQTQHGFTLPYAREKAELGCPFFKRSLQLDPHQRLRPSIPDGAVASLWPVNTDSDPRLDLMWKENGEPVMSSQEYQMYMPHGVPLPPPCTVNQDADKARYPSPNWRLIDPSSAQSSTQFRTELPDGQGLDRGLPQKSRQVFISA